MAKSLSQSHNSNEPEPGQAKIELTAQQLEAFEQQQAAIARQYPFELIESLAFNASTTLFDYLKAHQAPEAVLELVNASYALTDKVWRMRTGDLNDNEAAELVGEVATAAAGIVALGGVFGERYTSSNPREPLPWSPANTE